MAAFWVREPAILFRKDKVAQIWPTAQMTSDEKLNAITRLVIILTAVGYLLTQTARILVTGIITILAIVVLRKTQRAQEVKEAIKRVGKEGFTSPEVYEMTKDVYTAPTPKNPAMNVLLPEIKYNPKREPAAPSFNPAVVQDIDRNTQDFVLSNLGDPRLRKKLFQDLGDSFTFDQSMRAWYSTANTQIPNDQGAFAEYCYGDMISCKEGDPLACQRNMPPRWING